MSKLMQLLTVCLLTVGMTACSSTSKIPLTYETYHDGEEGGFAVASTLIYGKKNALLIDAQFSPQDATQIVDKIRAAGKTLSTVFISYPEADYYFGLETIKKAFPDVKIIATQETVNAIRETAEAKLAFWGRVAADRVPENIVIPDVITQDNFVFDGKRIEIKGTDRQNAISNYIWIPSLKLVAGGSVVFSHMHPWIVNAGTAEERKAWADELNTMFMLQPEVVIPSHYIGELPSGIEALSFSRDYINVFGQVLETQKTTERVVNNMKKLYPNLQGVDNLTTSVKLINGDLDAVR